MSKTPAKPTDARYAFSTPKRIDATASHIITSSHEHHQSWWAGPVRADPPRWHVRFYSINGHFRAQLMCAGREVIEALDYHAGRSKAGDGSIIMPGYHWDVYPLLSGAVEKQRWAVDNQSGDRYHMLQLVCVRWRIELNEEAQLGIK